MTLTGKGRVVGDGEKERGGADGLPHKAETMNKENVGMKREEIKGSGRGPSPTKRKPASPKLPTRLPKKPVKRGFSEQVTQVTQRGERDQNPPPLPLPAVLDLMDKLIGARIDMTDDQRTAVVLWIAHTYVYNRFVYTPKLFITAIDKMMGKSALLELVNAFSHRSRMSKAGTTPSYIGRVFEKHGPMTLVLDQQDAMKRSDTALIELLNSGYEVGSTKGMSVGKGKDYEPEDFVVGYPQAMGMIGSLPSEVLASRCINVMMQPADPKKRGEIVRLRVERPMWDRINRKPINEAVLVRRSLENWDIYKDLPKVIRGPGCPVKDRYEDSWQPLLAIADLAGNKWPDKARQAFCTLAEDVPEEPPKRELVLLKKAVKIADRWEGLIILPDELHRMVGDNVDGWPMSKRQQGNYLSAVGVKSKPVKVKGETVKAYERQAILDAGERWKVKGET